MESGISAKSVEEWVRLAEELGNLISEDERNELRCLRKEVRELRMGKEILAKATLVQAVNATHSLKRSAGDK